MKLNYNVTEESYVEFNLYHAKNSKALKKSVTLQRVLVPIIDILLAFFLSFILDMPILFLLMPFLIAGGLGAIFYSSYYFRQVRRTAQKMIREGNNDVMLGKQTMIFTVGDFREISAAGHISTNFSSTPSLTAV